MSVFAQGQGQAAEQYVPVTMLITAAMFAAGQPADLPDPARSGPCPSARRSGAYAQTFTRFRETVRQASRYRDLARFLVCILFYQAGVQTVISIAAIYAQQAMGFGTQQTLLMLLVVNVTASIGAFAFGQYQDRLGHVRSVALTLVGWLLTTLVAWRADGPGLFWVAANLAGLCMGASQSAGRALVGYLSPEARRARVLRPVGRLAVKLSSIFGPLTYGAVSWVSGGDHRLAMLATGAFFVAGLVILAGIDPERGRRAAEAG